jgi:hypothetical protein
MLNQKFSFYALFRARDHLLNRYTHALANDTRYHDFPIVALPPFLRLGLGVSQGRSGGKFQCLIVDYNMLSNHSRSDRSRILGS